MITFFISIILLIIGYFIYGTFVEKIFHPDNRKTPCIIHPDGVDFVPIKKRRAFLIQLLNIAGLGPIFGAISGAIWGPVVYIWIVLGTIFAGGVHDYICGMTSIRNDGASVSEVAGLYLGKIVKNIMRIFSVVLLVMIGVVFMVGPAELISILTPNKFGTGFWIIIILIYYFIATFLPINKVISKLYPLFGLCLIIMAVGVGCATIFNSNIRPMMEMTLQNLHPEGKPIWPLMFITVACGAISGFHATQSPMISRCLTSEKEGRFVFYGAMVAEGIIALIWAAAGIAFYYNPNTGMLPLLQAGGGNSSVVYEMCTSLIGSIGGIFALVGVIACPITSGDTAFRSARLTIADWFKINQKDIKKRLLISVPLLLVGYIISKLNYQIIWRYFSWSNQVLAMIVLWTGAVYLGKEVSKKASLIAAIPATFMSAVCITYILMAEEGFKISSTIAYPIGIVAAIILASLYIYKLLNINKIKKTL